MSSCLHNTPRGFLFLCLRCQGCGVEAGLAKARRWGRGGCREKRPLTLFARGEGKREFGPKAPKTTWTPLSSHCHQKFHSGFGGSSKNSDKAPAPPLWVGEGHCPGAGTGSPSHCLGATLGSHEPPHTFHSFRAYSGNSALVTETGNRAPLILSMGAKGPGWKAGQGPLPHLFSSVPVHPLEARLGYVPRDPE